MFAAGKWIIYGLLVCVVAGCGAEAEVPAEAPSPTTVEKPSVGDATLTAIGELQVSDPIQRAKELFPAPPGADKTEEPELTLANETHFGWANDKQVVDVFAATGGITTISLLKKNLTPEERQTEVDQELERFDEPTENAEGDKTAAYLWRDGDYVRIVVVFQAGASQGVLKVAGSAAALEARGFPLSNIAELVAAFDETVVQ
jgi:hypothetical protein